MLSGSAMQSCNSFVSLQASLLFGSSTSWDHEFMTLLLANSLYRCRPSEC